MSNTSSSSNSGQSTRPLGAQKDKRQFSKSQHTLILGWSNRVYSILKELSIANSNVRKARVIILSDLSHESMAEEIRSRVGDVGKMKIIFRTGDATEPADLELANIAKAKSVIVLNDEEESDALSLNTVLAVQTALPNSETKIITEINDAKAAAVLRTATHGHVINVRSEDVIARVITQASRRAGLAEVVVDLLNFAGDEIYFASVPALYGKKYADALLAFNEASVIGLLGTDGYAMLNPTPDTEIANGMKIIAIAEDDDKVIYTGVREDIANRKIELVKKTQPSLQKMLIVGWSEVGRSVLEELAFFLPKGSSAHILFDSSLVSKEDLANLKFGSIRVTKEEISADNSNLVAAVSKSNYDEVIVLGSRKLVSHREADAKTMLSLLELNQLIDGNNKIHTRLVAEILDSSTTDLAQASSTNDLVVSDLLAAQVIAQVSENPGLAPVFTDLFDAEGATINLQPISDYAPLGKSISFAELVANARNHSESAIGYRVGGSKGASTGIVMNPSKLSEFVPVEGDSLIVIGDLS